VADYQIRNNKPDNFTVELFLSATNNWMQLSNFNTLDQAVQYIRKRQADESFKEKLYDSVGRLVAPIETPPDQPVDNPPA